YASPAVADGLVYISSSRNLCAVDASTGEQRGGVRAARGHRRRDVARRGAGHVACSVL
ncbi:PQQ-binding-like beta-propeller repeat protein, partial [Streptomyces sp. NPDC005388]|uniref:PQQ-binding-like beta-propeller repeat protein n=1 Tax=Streptomyces sp. NPDC005388 TaxID=3156717 RepID=UPI0033B2BF1F